MTGYSGIGNNGPNMTTHVGQTANVTCRARWAITR